MARAVYVRRGVATKYVTIVAVHPTDTDEHLIDLALELSNETRPRLFGWGVKRHPDEGTATVALHID